MDPLLYVVAAGLVGILVILLAFLKRTQGGAPQDPPDGARNARPVPRQAGVPGNRPRGARQRLAAGRRQQRQDSDEEDEEEEEDITDQFGQLEGKIGAKKLLKLQNKAERKAQREAEQQEREDRKKREAAQEEQNKKEEARREAEEAVREAEEKKRKEEQEKRVYEEYLKMKEAFTVEEEGTHEAELEQDTDSLLQDFIDYIKQSKVVMLEDLAAHFKLKTQDAIDRVKSLQEEGRLTGVIDDRGKFIYITVHELEAVAKFIKQRGRVSITELAESSNILINLNPDSKQTMQKLFAKETVTA